MNDVEPCRLHPRPNPSSIVSFRQASPQEVRDEGIHGNSLRGGSFLEPLVEFLIHAGDELLHMSMIAGPSKMLSSLPSELGLEVRARFGLTDENEGSVITMWVE